MTVAGSARPAWLSGFEPAESPRRAGLGSSPSRPTSAGPGAHAMVRSAQRILSDDGSRLRDTRTAEATGLVSLRDFMDSFPLVPLTVIPRLSLADLIECEHGLRSLRATLSPDNPDDAQLDKYVSRQLSVVQRHMEPARARDRVLRLLQGDEEPTMSTLSAPMLATTNNSIKVPSSGSSPLPVFLQAPMQSASSMPKPPQLSKATCSVKSTSALGGLKAAAPSNNAPPAKRRDSDQLARARALAHATVTSTTASTASFVISCTETSLKARRRKRPKKKTDEALAADRARQLEREREKRRQAAYQRLLARQELQARKKEQSVDQKNLEKTSTCSDSEKSTQQTSSVSTASDQGPDSSSDESEVSNCSDGDADDEQAILALTVVTTGAPDDKSDGDGDAVASADDANDDDDDDDDDNDDARAAVVDRGIRDVEDGNVRFDSEPSRPRERSRDAVDGTSSNQQQEDESVVHTHRQQDSAALSNVSEKEGQDAGVNQWPLETDHAVNELDVARQVLDAESEQRAEIANQIQQFIAERTRWAMENLRAERARPVTPAPEVDDEKMARSQSPSSTTEGREALEDPPEPVDEPDTPSLAVDDLPSEPAIPVIDPDSTTASTRTPGLLVKRPRRRVRPATDAVIPRPLCRDVPDYRGYFADFFCILTSVYEQHQSGAMSATATPSAASSHAAEQALRLQLKLYETWQSIMSDYATVFGRQTATTAPAWDAPRGASSPSTPHYRINSQTRREVCDIVVSALEKDDSAWEEHPSGLGLKTTWNLLWTWSKPQVERKTLLVWQKVNHFKQAKALTRKDCLKRNLGKYAALGGRLRQAFDIAPMTFLLPQEYVAFVQAFHERGRRLQAAQRDDATATKNNIWIMKPVALSRGRGISLVNDLTQVVYGEQVVIQEYIATPLLLDGYKFDLRVYVLVTSFNPLEAFFYEEGFVRLCTQPYQDSDLSNLFIHLTNSSIQKENEAALHSGDQPSHPAAASGPSAAAASEDAGGTKMTLAYLWKRLAAMGADVAQVKQDIFAVILKSLLCGEDHIPFQVNSFDLLGYDILLDSTLRPWLIEINSSPSMARENALDFQVKDALMLDTMRLVRPLRFDRAQLVDVLRRRFHEAENERRRVHGAASTRHPRETEELAARQLNEDLSAILLGQVPRQYGELPAHLGSFTRLCPHTTLYNQLIKLKKSCLRSDRRP
ncbi:hypothetical protein P43SY_006254 [Pythium insidiosum]|uniref:Tubulin-tyrosine ligase family n=1 Tax=Pythium insidiosum TaxID=114742 RepID=A0AAD5LH16_PYTIN|nr:hypothetical protein P43SY_006254 [Pythium insidiosum]